MAALVIAVLVLVVAAIGYRNATTEPVVRRAYVGVADWPQGTPPVTVLTLADLHMAAPDMPPKRLRAILQRLNALRPDLILVAGDLLSRKLLAARHYSADEVVGVLTTLEAPLGVLAVPGNHEHWSGIAAFERAFAERGIPFLRNTAVRRGPLRIAAADDVMTEHADMPATLARLDRLGPGPAILLTHSADLLPNFSRPFAAVFAGHTHCGQIVLPVLGALSYASSHGARYGCGDILDDDQRIFVTAGLGTSVVPLRFGAPPDVWLVTLGPVR